METGNIAPRIGLEPTSLPLHATALSISPHRLPNFITLSTPVRPCGGPLPETSERTVKTTAVFWTENDRNPIPSDFATLIPPLSVDKKKAAEMENGGGA